MSKFKKGLEAFENQNYEQAFFYLQPLAEEGNAEAQCILGNLYHLGLGVKKNILEAVIWYYQSAQQGYSVAANNLGGIYLIGEQEIEQNITEAEQWFQKAREQRFMPTPTESEYLFCTLKNY